MKHIHGIAPCFQRTGLGLCVAATCALGWSELDTRVVRVVFATDRRMTVVARRAMTSDVISQTGLLANNWMTSLSQNMTMDLATNIKHRHD